MNRQPNDDLFEESRMSFGDHLEELRVVLFRCVIGLAIGMVIGLYFTKDVVNFLQWPVEEAISDFRLEVARRKIQDQVGFVSAEKEFLLSDQKKIPSSVFVDPAEIYMMLREYRPTEFSGGFDPLDFSGRTVPLSVLPSVSQSLIDGKVNQASGKPKADAKDLAAAAEHLSSLLSAEEKANLKNIAGKNAKDCQSSDQIQVLNVLNRLAGAVRWFDDSSLDKIYKANEPGWLLQAWNDFWQIKNNNPDSALARLKANLLESPDAKLEKRLQKSLLQKMFLVGEAGSDYSKVELWMPVKATTQALGTSEAFMIYLKAMVLVGLVVSGPYLFFQVWSFVAAGLYPSEKKYVYIYLPFSLALFFAGVSVAFIFAFKPVLSFLFSFNAELGIDPNPQIGQWLSFVLFLPLGFGIAFQLPIVMMLLYRIGIISLGVYISQWRLAILIIAVLSMLLTPADPISMVLLGGPLTLLYGLGVFLCWMFPRSSDTRSLTESSS